MNATMELTAELETRKAAREEAFTDLARQIAGGTKPNAATVEKILGAADKSTADLQQAIDLHQKRRALRAKLDDKALAETALAEANRMIEAENAKLDEARKVHAAAVRPHLIARQAAQQTIASAVTADHELLRTAPQRREALRLTTEREQLARKANEIRKRKDENESWARSARGQAEHYRKGDMLGGIERNAPAEHEDAQGAEFARRAKWNGEELAKIEADIAEMSATISKLEAEALNP